ncbi:ferrous iron transporter B [Atopobacter sp. AH10]|uniref:ferrous iron transporter B n=1 Tax=Atopobacter sp. AH10 TaxID=2315861 RepID=UPI000EF27682|nr:ferrous iron transporter B [Atopobacter sp. AH10]
MGISKFWQEEKSHKEKLGEKVNHAYTVALAGNPNVGKSTVFNGLTGLHQHTGNWPGKTVEVAKGDYDSRTAHFTLVDLPGTYSLSAHSPEEEVARSFIESNDSDVTVVVCDATALERNLNLVLQILLLTQNVVVCVNLMDEAERKGIKVNLKQLEQQLGVRVIASSANHGKGLKELMRAVEETANGTYRPNTLVREHLQSMLSDNEQEKVEALIDRAASIAKCALTFPNTAYDLLDRRLDRLFTSRFTGVPIMLLLLMTVFWLTIEGANFPSDMIATVLFAFHKVLLKWTLAWGWPLWLRGCLVDGVYKVVAWVVSVMLPPMAIFFPMFTLLEDFGYLPRIAFNLDRSFQRAGACGKQALSMCMGFGCNAAGVTGARIIDSPREQLIAIITNNFVPCNGRFPILISVISIFFVGTHVNFFTSFKAASFLTAAILLGVFMTMGISYLLSKTILSGMPSSFTLELPPYRKPRIGQVVVRSIFDRTLFVLARALKVSAPVGLVIWILANVHLGDATILTHFIQFLDPFARLMGLDGVILMAFILGFPANEIVIPCMLMGYLATSTIVDFDSLDQLRQLFLTNGWTWLTALNVILFTLFHWPCGTTILTIKKETGSNHWTWVSFWVPTVTGIFLCLVTTAVAHLFHLI